MVGLSAHSRFRQRRRMRSVGHGICPDQAIATCGPGGSIIWNGAGTAAWLRHDRHAALACCPAGRRPHHFADAVHCAGIRSASCVAPTAGKGYGITARRGFDERIGLRLNWPRRTVFCPSRKRKESAAVEISFSTNARIRVEKFHVEPRSNNRHIRFSIR